MVGDIFLSVVQAFLGLHVKLLQMLLTFHQKFRQNIPKIIIGEHIIWHRNINS
jgi:hypothetical protein